MLKLPPLIQLRAFEAAARHASFRMAAAELGVTPTAISHQIKLLEIYCGQPLFRRRPRPLALTAEAERLFAVINHGLESFSEALNALGSGTAQDRLRVTTTNAFAARWLLPRLPLWRKAHPRLQLNIVGTDAVLDLKTGEADVAIRYARRPPTDGPCSELMRDTFDVVASPKLTGALRRSLSPAEIARFPLIETEWPPADRDAPNWRQWAKLVRKRHKTVPDFAALSSLSFREELHAIEAAIAGQGVAICSDVLVGPELASGALLRLSKLTLPGYGFYIVHRADHPRAAAIDTFSTWAHRCSHQAISASPRDPPNHCVARS